MIKRTDKMETEAAAALEAIGRLNRQVVKQLERQRFELEDAQIESDKLAHSISHDLRSPLHIIEGFAEMLVKHSGQDLDEKGRHYLDRITTAAAQIGQMLDKILAFSQMAKSEMRCAPVDLGALVKKIVHDLDAEKGNRRVVWLIGNLPTVLADAKLIGEVMENLASNAFKFTRSREVARIQFGTEGEEADLKFFVRDNGASFDIKHRETMFGSAVGKRPPEDSKGGFMKLAYVQRIIQRHGGRLWTEAEPNGGATFYFTLPVDGTDPAPDPGSL
jgi:light-regulated signal transduction histidine kinase (bacteriophytochrome)